MAHYNVRVIISSTSYRSAGSWQDQLHDAEPCVRTSTRFAAGYRRRIGWHYGQPVSLAWRKAHGKAMRTFIRVFFSSTATSRTPSPFFPSTEAVAFGGPLA